MFGTIRGHAQCAINRYDLTRPRYARTGSRRDKGIPAFQAVSDGYLSWPDVSSCESSDTLIHYVTNATWCQEVRDS